MNRDLNAEGMKILQEGLVQTRDTASAKALRWECLEHLHNSKEACGLEQSKQRGVGDVSGSQDWILKIPGPEAGWHHDSWQQ